jgi:hypothetical protein
MGTRTKAEDGAEIRDPRLDEVLRRLVDAYRPETIYLFGSYARGDAGPDSDYDIMVIVPDDAAPERRRSRLAHRCVAGRRPRLILLGTERRIVTLESPCRGRDGCGRRGSRRRSPSAAVELAWRSMSS